MFLNEDEIKLENEYLEQGYIIRPAADLEALEWIRNKFIWLIAETLDFDVRQLIERKFQCKIFDEYGAEHTYLYGKCRFAIQIIKR